MSSNEIVKKSDWLTKEEKQVINRQFFPQGADDGDKIYCMKVAEAFNLNPILKQIYFVPRKTQVNGQWAEKVEPLAGRDSFLTLAHRTGKFNGIESKVEIKDTPVLKDGKWIRENDLVATATVYRTDCERPFIVSVNYREYVQTKRNGEVTQFWRDKPETMLKKVAESQVLRKAFDITGLYAEEEYEEKYINEKLVKTKQINQPKQADLNSLSAPKKDDAIDIEIEAPKEQKVSQTPSQQMKQALLQKGVDELKAEEWCMKNSEAIPTFLADPASIDVVVDELAEF